MTAAPAAVRCSCGKSWEVAPRADGTLPVTARCAAARGGCGKSVRVPRRLEVAPPSAAGREWSPPSEPRQPRLCAGPCPHCGEHRVYAEPRGTLRLCVACGTKVTPPGVLAPYERGTAAVRQVTSQRETDLAALDLAGRKGLMLGQLRALAGDDRLDDASKMKAEWFAEQVRAAATGGRLDDLAALFDGAGIRPRRWWQPRPAVLAAGYGDGEPGSGYDDGETGGDYADDDDGQDDGVLLVPAAPASITAQQARAQPQRARWADGLAARGWRLAAAGGTCQVIADGLRCAQPTGGHPPVTDGLTVAWACTAHYYALSAAVAAVNRARGIT